MNQIISLLQQNVDKNDLRKAIYTIFNILPDGSNLEDWMKEVLKDDVKLNFVEGNVGVCINDTWEYSDIYYMYKGFRIPKEYDIKANTLYFEGKILTSPILLITKALYINGGKYPPYYRFVSTNGEFSATCFDACQSKYKMTNIQLYINNFVYLNSLQPKKIEIITF